MLITTFSVTLRNTFTLRLKQYLYSRLLRHRKCTEINFTKTVVRQLQFMGLLFIPEGFQTCKLQSVVFELI